MRLGILVCALVSSCIVACMCWLLGSKLCSPSPNPPPTLTFPASIVVTIHDWEKDTSRRIPVDWKSPLAMSLTRVESGAKYTIRSREKYLREHPEITSSGINISPPHTRYDLSIKDVKGKHVDSLPMDDTIRLVNVRGSIRDIALIETWASAVLEPPLSEENTNGHKSSIRGHSNDQSQDAKWTQAIVGKWRNTDTNADGQLAEGLTEYLADGSAHTEVTLKKPQHQLSFEITWKWKIENGHIYHVLESSSYFPLPVGYSTADRIVTVSEKEITYVEGSTGKTRVAQRVE